jgi:ligand-binding SRPBCC domain-containing protein
MPTIHLTTFIAAPVERVFDLSRSVNLHKVSTAGRHERIVDGVMSGLLQIGDTVTWQARHLYRERRFTSAVTEMERPLHFIEEMRKGDFKSFRHEHHFKGIDNGTLLIDLLHFESPYGILGQLLNQYYLTEYLRSLLQVRNDVIREYAESTKWKALLIK